MDPTLQRSKPAERRKVHFKEKPKDEKPPAEKPSVETPPTHNENETSLPL
jgi:hypothetical protein